jgi:hypothetical protein
MISMFLRHSTKCSFKQHYHYASAVMALSQQQLFLCVVLVVAATCARQAVWTACGPASTAAGVL